jgi:metallo-beta-lactamase family protein
MNGDKVVRIYGEEFHVNADVQVIRSFSAHGDYNDICQYLACQDLKLVKKLFLVHGEYETQKNFQTRLLKKGFFEVDIPQMHKEVYL